MVQDKYLKHMREPAKPSERGEASSFQVDDFEALYLRRALREYAHYDHERGSDRAGIASAYVEYIDEKVRDNGNNIVHVYAHTEEAYQTLVDAIAGIRTPPTELRDQIELYIRDNL